MPSNTELPETELPPPAEPKKARAKKKLASAALTEMDTDASADVSANIDANVAISEFVESENTALDQPAPSAFALGADLDSSAELSVDAQSDGDTDSDADIENTDSENQVANFLTAPALPLMQILEAAIMAANQPMTVEQLSELFDEKDRPTHNDIAQTLENLSLACNDRGVELVEVASGFRFQIKTNVYAYVARMWTERPARYSRALLETLSLIAYRQPITRAEIEAVRGVAVSSQTVRTLEEREWIRVVGHREVPGRPALFGTTRAFLDYFKLKNLDDLPTLSEIKDMEALAPEFDFDSTSKPVAPPIHIQIDTQTANDGAANEGNATEATADTSDALSETESKANDHEGDAAAIASGDDAITDSQSDAATIDDQSVGAANDAINDVSTERSDAVDIDIDVEIEDTSQVEPTLAAEASPEMQFASEPNPAVDVDQIDTSSKTTLPPNAADAHLSPQDAADTPPSD